MFVKTNRNFFDTLTGDYRYAGDEFEVSKERFNELNEKVPGFVTELNPKTKKEIDPLDNLTVAEIKALLDEKGVDYDPKAKKEELKALLK